MNRTLSSSFEVDSYYYYFILLLRTAYHTSHILSNPLIRSVEVISQPSRSIHHQERERERSSTTLSSTPPKKIHHIKHPV